MCLDAVLEHRHQLRLQELVVVGNVEADQAFEGGVVREHGPERLSLVEPANLPDKPHWPNRPLVIGGGLLAGAVLGLLLALVIELLQRPVRSPVQVEGLGLPVLGIVPIMEQAPKKRRWWSLFRRREAELA